MSLAPVTWVLILEIFPNRIRGAAMSAVTALWIASFILTYTLRCLITLWVLPAQILFHSRSEEHRDCRF